jgi:uncharacterized protein (TIGR03118 family)
VNLLSQYKRIAALSLLMSGSVFAQTYTQTNLVSNVPGGANQTDPQLVAPFGLSRGSNTAWWSADTIAGVSTLYSGTGAKQSLVVTIPPANPNNASTPTGTPSSVMFNGSATDFLLAPGMPASFLFGTLDGSIAGWNPNVAIASGATAPSTHAVTVVRNPDGSEYTGITSALIDGKRYLYAANFTQNRVDVFDNSFRRVTLHGDRSDEYRFDDSRFYANHAPFVDDRLPQGYVPFNVQAIGNDIVVTYAFHPNRSAPFETDGPGLGYADVYSSSGKLLERLEHGNFMNAPWGVALAPLDFGRFSHDLLIGQSSRDDTESSGVIAAFDLTTGKFDGLLKDTGGKPIVIKGILGIAAGNVAPSNFDSAGAPGAELYFTAAPAQGSAIGGLFGYLAPVTTELTQGSAQ